MTCAKPNFKMYTGLVEQFEYCETCGEKRADHAENTSGMTVQRLRDYTIASLRPLTHPGWTGNMSSPTPPPPPTAPSPMQTGRTPVTAPCFADVVKTYHPLSVGSDLLIPLAYYRAIRTLRIQRGVLPDSASALPVFLTRSNLDNFCGVDRSVDPNGLAGLEYSSPYVANPIPFSESLVEASAVVAREGYHPDAYFMSPADYKVFLNDVGIPYINKAQINFSAGTIEVQPLSDLPSGIAYLLTLDTWARTPGFGIYCNSPGQNVKVFL